jgi:biotin synthase
MEPRARAGAAGARNGARVKADAVAPRGIYRPNDNILTPAMRFARLRADVDRGGDHARGHAGEMYRCGCTRCLNLLLTYPEGCRANCAYCVASARHREATRDYATATSSGSTGRRWRWPRWWKSWRQGAASPFQRMCISMITIRARTRTRVVLKAWTDRIAHIPVSILSNPDE